MDISNEHFRELLAFHAWRRERVIRLLETISPSYFSKQIDGSFSSLLIIIKHLVWAEKVWFSRIKKGTVASMKDSDMKGLIKEWKEAGKDWEKYLAKVNPASLQASYSYYNTSGEKFSNTLPQILTHMVDHASYHTGQLMSAIRAFGLEPVSTNYIHYLRAQQQ